VKPLIRGSCSACHNPGQLRGGLDLARFLDESGGQALKERDLWERVARKLQAREMPPEGQPRPPAQQIAAATQFIQQYYAQQDSTAIIEPGRVTARRLNRYEYTNTVRDLLGVNLRVADDFPPDPYAYGFDNIGDSLSLSPILTEMYMRAAEQIARATIATGPPPKVLSVRYESRTMGQQRQMNVQTIHDFPADANYSLGFQWAQSEPLGTTVTGHIYLDGKEVLNRTIVLTGLEDHAMVATRVPVASGPHLFEVRMEVAPDAHQPKPLHGSLPYPTVLEVVGPFDPKPFDQTASFKQIFFKGRPRPGQEPKYAREILARLATRAYRRPVTRSELDQLVRLAGLVHSRGGSFYEGIQVAIEGILMSPNFLFRIERDLPGDGPRRITDFELSSRLSYFLWSSMPDDELFSLAEKNQLHNPGVLQAQVRRMMADPRAGSLASNFGEQWLETRNIEFQKPDAKTFPNYDLELRDDMLTETRLFLQSIITEDRSILELLNAKYTYLNERLAKFYGIPGVEGSEFRRVDLTGTGRGGILTQASVLTATSYPTRTSPTIRGKWILTNILNTPPPEPPANVPALTGSSEGAKFTSIRQRLEMHRSNPVCASCHQGMDPLGFALENYDAIGRWRASESGAPINASGRLPDGTTFNGALELKAVLLAQSSRFIDTVSEKLLTYALGRGLEPYDRPAIARIEDRVKASGDRFSVLIDGIVDSAPFQMRRSETIQSTPLSETAQEHH